MSIGEKLLSETEKKCIDVLMTKYGLLRQEMMFCIGGVKAHTRFFQIFGGGSIVVLWTILGTTSATIYGISRDKLLFVALLAVTTVSFYFIFDLLENLFTMSHLSARLAIIENEINYIFGEPILHWESTVAPEYLTEKKMRHRVVPRFVLWIFQGITAYSLAVVIPIILYFEIWKNVGFTFRISLILALIWTVLCGSLGVYVWYYIMHSSRDENAKIIGRVILSRKMRNRP